MGALRKYSAELYDAEYKGLEYARPGKRRVIEAVKGGFERKLRIIAEAITELDADIAERERIGRDVREGVERDLSGLGFELKELKHWTMGGVPIIETRRLGLEREVLRLMDRERLERVREWSDISNLKRKRREFIMEYQGLLRTRDMIGEQSLTEKSTVESLVHKRDTQEGNN
jgi:hypothetical protein